MSSLNGNVINVNLPGRAFYRNTVYITNFKLNQALQCFNLGATSNKIDAIHEKILKLLY